MNRAIPFIFILVFWFGLVSNAPALNISLTSEVDTTQTTKNVPINLTVRLEVSGDRRFQNPDELFPEISEIPGFDIIQRTGPNRVQQMTNIGAMRYKLSITRGYVLLPKSEGTLTIPAFKSTYNGEVYITNPIQINVGAAPTAAAPTNNAASPDDAPPSSGASEDIEIVYPKSTNAELNQLLQQGAIFLKPVINKKTIYVGEVFHLRYEIYLDENAWQWRRIGDLNFSPIPTSFGGFTKQNEKGPGLGQWKSENIGDKVYAKNVVYDVDLQPQKIGKQIIEPWMLKATYGNRFSVWGRSESFIIPTAPIEVTVKSLPEEGQPDSFTGAVGQFRVKVKLDKQEVSQNDVVTLQIMVSGNGRLSTVKEPKLPTLPQFEQYGDIKSHVEKDSSHGLGLEGAKIFELILRPLESGTLTIPPIEYAYFDPEFGDYFEAKTDPLKLEVEPASGGDEQPLVVSAQPSTGGMTGNMRQTMTINEDIQFIQTTGFRAEQRPSLVKQTGFWAFQIFPLLLIVGSFAMRMQRERLRGDRGLARRKQARGMADRRLKAVRRFMQKNEAEAFYAELDRTLRGFLSDHLNVADRGMTIDRISRELKQRDVDEELIRETIDLLETCDHARYAPGAENSNRLNDLYSQGRNTIQKLAVALK